MHWLIVGYALVGIVVANLCMVGEHWDAEDAKLTALACGTFWLALVPVLLLVLVVKAIFEVVLIPSTIFRKRSTK